METYLSSQKTTWLPWFARGILLLIFIVLIARLFELQIIKGSYYKNLAEGNRIRRVAINAPRGNILARGGEVLVANKEVKKRVIFSPEEGYEKVEDIKGAAPEEIITEWERYYPVGEIAAHVTGYVGEVSENELGKVDPSCLDKGPRRLGEYMGRTGLEETYNCELTGNDGELLLEVDTTGKIIRLLGRKDPVPGKDLTTSIDLGLQERLAKDLEEKTSVPKELLPDPKNLNAAGIITDGKGEVLALYSYPSYDPNIFVEKKLGDKVGEVLNDERLPLFNRVIGGDYHPGSVYKPLVAIASLQEKTIDKDFNFNDEGKIEIKTPYGDFTYNNWYYTQYGGVEGEIGVERALARSTDTFFYTLGEMIGVDKLVSWSEKFGLNQKTGIDLSGEVVGLVPSPEWKEKTKGEKWFLGNTYHMSIGQGDLAITPAEENRMISAISQDGKLCDLRLVGKPECEDMQLDKEDVELVKSGMRQACSTGGTGFTFFDFTPKNLDENNRVACKTGTAEITDSENPHAWFVAFSPVDLPEIVATVLVENGGEGSRVSGPIVRDIFDYWYQNR